jgi:hypothetical protein
LFGEGHIASEKPASVQAAQGAPSSTSRHRQAQDLLWQTDNFMDHPSNTIGRAEVPCHESLLPLAALFSIIALGPARRKASWVGLSDVDLRLVAGQSGLGPAFKRINRTWATCGTT